jgi:hypothetical protein
MSYRVGYERANADATDQVLSAMLTARLAQLYRR